MIDITSDLVAILKEYTSDVEEGLEKAQARTARKGAKMLRESPDTPRSKGGGDYARNWASRKVRGGGYSIHNKKHYRLTHLLEHGHAKVNGGRVKAYPHIKPTEDKLVSEYENEVVKELNR